MTTIKLADKSVFGNATITMMFDPKSYELRQWTITDAQGKDTTVMIFNVQQGGSVDQNLFKIDYKKNIELNKKGGAGALSARVQLTNARRRHLRFVILGLDPRICSRRELVQRRPWCSCPRRPSRACRRCSGRARA